MAAAPSPSSDMEYSVHRCRFSDWTPTAIRGIAVDSFSPLVAIGREDGDIEICNSSNKWYVQARVPGSTSFQLRSLQFAAVAAEAGRLFGISLRGVLFEVDVAAAGIKNIRDSYGGAAWSLAMNPRQPNLALGCEDGAVRVFSYDGNQLEYVKSYTTTGSRVLSAAYHPKLPQLCVGCADGTIRCIDETSGRSLFRLTGDIYRGAATYIWSLLVLSDSTIVSGDNRGHVQFWDGTTGVLMSTLNQHAADILCIATDASQNQVFASGVDSKVTCIKRISSVFDPTNQGGLPGADLLPPSSSQWVYTSAHRPHTHDVFALAVCTHSATSVSAGGVSDSHVEGVLLSGGLDTKLCLYSTTEYLRTRPTWILPTPTKGLVGTACDNGVIAMKHSHNVDIWRLELAGASADASRSPPVTLDRRLEAKGADHIHAMALAADGRLLALSSASGTRLYAVGEYTRKAQKSRRSSKAASVDSFVPIPLPGEISQRLCHLLTFTADSRCLSAIAAGKGGEESTQIFLLGISGGSAVAAGGSGAGDNDSKRKKKGHSSGTDADTTVATSAADGGRSAYSVSLRHVFKHSRNVSAWLGADSKKGTVMNKLVGSLEHICTACSFSFDGQWIAVASGGNSVYIYEIDRLNLHWRLPASSAPVSAIAFHPQERSSLVVALADNSFWIYDVALMQLSPWSAQFTDKIPPAVRNIPGPIEGIVFDNNRPDTVIFHGQGFAVFTDTKKAIPKEPKRITPMQSLSHMTPSQKRKHHELEEANKIATESNFAIVSTYRSLIHVGCTQKSELVVVENPWVHVLGKLPETLSRERYGT